MKLTKECEKVFNPWYKDYVKKYKNGNWLIYIIYTEFFWALPKSFQWGVLQLFFDSVEVDILISSTKDGFWIKVISLDSYLIDEYKTREEAWEASIEAADKQFNKNYGK